jgi:hypothetical protein
VIVGSFGIPFVATAGTTVTEVTVHLAQPLGDRHVMDASERRLVQPSAG